MEEISLNIQDVHDTSDWMVHIDGIYSYVNRKPSVTPNVFSYIDIDKQTPLLKVLYTKALAEYNSISQIPSRYIEMAPGVMLDAFNTLEVLNLMTYAKAHTYLYSVLDKLDFALACVFDDNTNVVRERLERQCATYNVSYSQLSYAIMSGDISLLLGVDMRVFTDITMTLNNYINDIFCNPYTFAYTIGDRTVSLSSSLHTAESRIVTFIMHKVLFFNQLLINSIIAQFRDAVEPFENSAKCMLLSKGAYNIVFTARHSSFPKIKCDYRNNTVVLSPVTYRTLEV